MPLHVRAVNTAIESENKIHNDSVASGFGFHGGLVPGVTVYGYLASAAIEHFGESWLANGAMDVRFDQPIYHGDDVAISAQPQPEGRLRVVAGNCASGLAWIDASPKPSGVVCPDAAIGRRAASEESLAPGTLLGTLTRTLDLKQARMSAPLDPAIGVGRRAHPAILLALANEIFVANYELGPWIHVASEVRKSSPVTDGEAIRVQARVESLFERKGHQFVTLDVYINGPQFRPVEHIRHTAIWRLRAQR